MLKLILLRLQGKSQRVYRAGNHIVVVVLWLIVVNGAAISFIVREPDNPPIVALAILCGAGSTALLLRLLGAGIYISSSGVRVSNIFETFDLQWQEIKRFEIGRWKMIPRTCLIHLHDGRIKHASGVEESANFPKGDAEKIAEKLNAELERRS